jgi:hypothetical protein
VKWTKKVPWYTKTIIFLVKYLRAIETRFSNWISFHGDVGCCVEYSNVQNQVEIFNVIIKSKWLMLKSKWLSMILDVNFMTLTILKLEFSFI